MDLRRNENDGNSEPTQFPAQISHLALDIGGSLIKVVYFSTSRDNCIDCEGESSANDTLRLFSGNCKHPVLQGRLHFAKFETSKIKDCLEFISSKELHLGGGGAYKFAELFKENLGIDLDKEDEMDCLVAGANFLLKAVHREAYTFMDGQKEFVQIDQSDLYPYLLVNIGSGVSMIKVDGDGKFERVSGTNVGGGTFWGLGRLLTKCKSFDELLELSHQGNNRAIDMLVGEIYGGMDYSKIGLSSTTIASSFGKAVSDNKELEDYKPEDVARSLLRMISNNIGQISYLNALRFGLKRIFFGGFFIRGQPYTMDTISVAVHFWSKGEAKAMFLRHEGFLGALGAYVSYAKHSNDNVVCNQSTQLPVSASYAADPNYNPLSGDFNDNESIQCSVYAA
ncbi:pantothenate kinase 1 isoform X3 [Manihot esculenta]|uniref:pantothenate kinase 1 isoform X3 n=1 Tax=Manihot esculenta TaxID=3983 RepID=UPI001CC7DE95|nr:pantothenate kinase 1 isoform X3 [Manihot esculenta]